MIKEQKTKVEERKRSPIDTLKNIVSNEALLEVNPSLGGINPEISFQDGSTIYYGTGLCTAKELSVALPFDMLAMVLVAEKIRRTMGLKKILHHVADTHALSNNLFPSDKVKEQSHLVKETMLRLADNLKLSNFEVILASDLDQLPEYLDIYNQLKPNPNEYLKREVTDIEWYRKYKCAAIKLGWIIQATETNLGNDERVFDREYRHQINEGISFLYLKAGRTFDRERPKASPYIHIPKEARLLLKRDEDVKGKMARAAKELGDPRLFGAKAHLIDIVRLYEKLFGNFGNIPLEEKIKLIIDKVTA